MFGLRRFQRSRPNVLLITLDQFRPDTLNVHPVFGAFEKTAAFFPLVITYAPYTFASMPAIFSGIYGRRNGVNAYMKPQRFDHANCRLLPEYLQAAGYHTVGDTLNPLVLPDHGFDRLQIHDEHQDDLVARHRGLLHEVAGRAPFFLYLHYSGIHTAVVRDVVKVYDEFDPRYFGHRAENARRYEGYAVQAGNYLAEMLRTVDELGLGARTLLVVLTDHGCGLGERPGERTYGVYLYDDTVRTFAYFSWPGRVPAGTVVDSQVRTVDIAPTILDLLRIKPDPNARAMDGRSLLPLLGGRRDDRLAFMETGGVSGPWPSPHEPNVHAVRTPDWKLIENRATGTTELYDLRRDPAESQNLTGKAGAVETDLRRRLQEHLADGA